MFAATMFLVTVFPPTAQSSASPQHRRTIALNDGIVRCVALSPDGQTVAGCGDGFVQLFNVKTGQRFHQLKGHTKPVLSIAFTPSGKLIASSSADSTIRLWNVRTGRLVKTLRGRSRGSINCIAIASDGKTMFSSWTSGRYARPISIGRHDVYLWNVQTGWWEHIHERGVFPVFDEKSLLHAAFSPSGKQLAVAERAGNVRLYNVNFGLGKRFLWKHDNLHEVTWVAFAPDGRKLLSCGRDNTIRQWDVKTGKPLLKISGTNQGLDLKAAMTVTDADRQRGDSDMKKFDTNSDGFIDRDEILATRWLPSVKARADLNGDGRLSRDEAIRRWARNRRDALAATTCFQAAHYSANGSHIVSVTRDERIQIWDAAAGKLLGSVTGSSKQVLGMALSPDGRTIATCGGDKAIKLWNLATTPNNRSEIPSNRKPR